MGQATVSVPRNLSKVSCKKPRKPCPRMPRLCVRQKEPHFNPFFCIGIQQLHSYPPFNNSTPLPAVLLSFSPAGGLDIPFPGILYLPSLELRLKTFQGRKTHAATHIWDSFSCSRRSNLTLHGASDNTGL
jgi:hypothetical protein